MSEPISDEKLAMIRLDRREAYSLRNDTVFAIIARLDAAESRLATARREADLAQARERNIAKDYAELDELFQAASAVVEAARQLCAATPVGTYLPGWGGYLNELQRVLATHDAAAGAEGEGEG